MLVKDMFYSRYYEKACTFVLVFLFLSVFVFVFERKQKQLMMVKEVNTLDMMKTKIHLGLCSFLYLYLKEQITLYEDSSS